MDVVTSTAFSVDIDSLNNPKDPFVTNIKKMLKFDLFNPLFLIIALFPFITPVLEKMNYALFPTSVTNFFYAALKKLKSERVAKDHKKKRVDFLQLMVDSQTAGKPERGSSEEHTEKGEASQSPLTFSCFTSIVVSVYTRRNKIYRKPQPIRRVCGRSLSARASLTRCNTTTFSTKDRTLFMCSDGLYTTMIPLELSFNGLLAPKEPVILKLTPRQ
ncbi:cytochrome P450 3A27-like [Sinocyclocheilus rhinocerous]|uniref:cytochrome P450 3A27-like n=1 Tax=Sinocyclocheilus rhinocerous TaxID=307959 RepID=UPI0007B994A8|nr:PREDICTED: cytochrome P450 3A27-like [Sinocyclocheilus rhinocerous]